MYDDPNDQNQRDDTTQPSTSDDLQDPDDVKHQQSKPPSVTGEEDTMSGDTPVEPADIDEEMGKIGEEPDPEHPKPLGEE